MGFLSRLEVAVWIGTVGLWAISYYFVFHLNPPDHILGGFTAFCGLLGVYFAFHIHDRDHEK